MADSGGSGDPMRERLVEATAKAAAEHGYRDVTVEQIVRYAGLSRLDFDRRFANTEQALMAAYDSFLGRIWAEAAGACEGEGAWPERVRGATAAILAAIAETSGLARAFSVEAGASSLAATERQASAVEEFASLLREGRRIYPRAAALPEQMERALVGGIASIVSTHLLVEDLGALPRLEPELVELVLIPYLGRDEARREAVSQAG